MSWKGHTMILVKYRDNDPEKEIVHTAFVNLEALKKLYLKEPTSPEPPETPSLEFFEISPEDFERKMKLQR